MKFNYEMTEGRKEPLIWPKNKFFHEKNFL